MPKLTYGLVGHPVKHSLSPAMQNAAFKDLGIDAEYRLFDVAPPDLAGFLEDAAGKFAGFNVTVPHKIAAKEFILKRGLLDANAAKLGAVNTIKVEADGRLRGYNSDGAGFYRSLVEDLRFEPEGKNIVVLGAGGASSAIVMYLGAGPDRIYVYDVDVKKTGHLESNFRKHYGSNRMAVINKEGLKDALDGSQLLINATPIGMREADPSPIDKRLLRTGLYVYDLVYNRPETTLVREARMARCHATTGLGMLLYQGAIAFELWTGKDAPLEIMRKALKGAVR